MQLTGQPQLSIGGSIQQAGRQASADCLQARFEAYRTRPKALGLPLETDVARTRTLRPLHMGTGGVLPPPSSEEHVL